MLVTARSIVLIAFVATATAAQSAQPQVSWVCDVKMDRERGLATGTISLRVGAQLTLITDRPLNDCYVIPRLRYHTFGIPSQAITACHHGFGPTSEELYVLPGRGELLMYRKREADQRPSEKPRIIKHIPSATRASNHALQPTAGRRTDSLSMTNKHPFQTRLALPSGG